MRIPPALVLFYVAAIGGLCCTPYLSTMLGEAGIPDTLVPVALASIPVGILLGGPLWAWFADWSGKPHLILRVATAGCVGMGVVLAFSRSGPAMVGSLFLWSLFRAAQLPAADALTVRILGTDRRRYGVVRAWGSVAYLVAAWGAGWLRDSWPRAPLVLSASLMTFSLFLAFLLPVGGAAPATAKLADVRALLRHRVVLPFLVVTLLHGATQVAFDNFLSMRVRDLAFAPGVTGSAVAVAVAVEVAIMLGGRRLLELFGPERLAFAAVVDGTIYWVLASQVNSPGLFIALQALRGVAFGAFWIAGVSLLAERAPPSLANSAQALFPATGWGAGYLVAMALGTAVLARHGTSTLFEAVAAVDALAVVVCALLLLRRTA